MMRRSTVGQSDFKLPAIPTPTQTWPDVQGWTKYVKEVEVHVRGWTAKIEYVLSVLHHEPSVIKMGERPGTDVSVRFHVKNDLTFRIGPRGQMDGLWQRLGRIVRVPMAPIPVGHNELNRLRFTASDRDHLMTFLQGQELREALKQWLEDCPTRWNRPPTIELRHCDPDAQSVLTLSEYGFAKEDRAALLLDLAAQTLDRLVDMGVAETRTL